MTRMRYISRLGSKYNPSDAVARSIRRAQWFERKGSMGRRAGHVTRFRLARTWGVFVHQSASVGAIRFAHPSSVVIGAGVVVEDEVMIWQNVTLGALDVGETDYPVIRRGAKLFAGSSVLGAVEVGEGAVVGAHSLVLSDVPAGATVVGQPARVIRPQAD